MHDRTAWQHLWHRWLIEYNPAYLLSAALVLGGVVVLSDGVADMQGPLPKVLVGAIADVYAWALIGGAAVLTRLGLRRPAVLLALITALYQLDPTLHTETCVYLGSMGLVAGGVWLASFVLKLRALAWALKLRLSSSALLLPTLAAVGLLALPRTFATLSDRAEDSLVTAWLVLLFTAAAWSHREVISQVKLDEWGETVLQRGTAAVWLLWATLIAFHVWFWTYDLGIDISPAVFAAPVVIAARWAQRELTLIATLAIMLVLTALLLPEHFSLIALLGAASCALRGWSTPRRIARVEEPPPEQGGYRFPPELERSLSSITNVFWVFEATARTARLRLVVAASLAAYLALWTVSWTGGAWPAHVLALDIVLVGATAALVWKARQRIMLAPTSLSLTHYGIEVGLIAAPTTTLGWGATSVSLGFVLLLGSLAVSWRLSRSAPPEPGDGAAS